VTELVWRTPAVGRLRAYALGSFAWIYRRGLVTLRCVSFTLFPDESGHPRAQQSRMTWYVIGPSHEVLWAKPYRPPQDFHYPRGSIIHAPGVEPMPLEGGYEVPTERSMMMENALARHGGWA
jgi:hypothetical protein